jgi:hypothetical protein
MDLTSFIPSEDRSKRRMKLGIPLLGIGGLVVICSLTVFAVIMKRAEQIFAPSLVHIARKTYLSLYSLCFSTSIMVLGIVMSFGYKWNHALGLMFIDGVLVLSTLSTWVYLMKMRRTDSDRMQYSIPEFKKFSNAMFIWGILLTISAFAAIPTIAVLAYKHGGVFGY